MSANELAFRMTLYVLLPLLGVWGSLLMWIFAAS